MIMMTISGISSKQTTYSLMIDLSIPKRMSKWKTPCMMKSPTRLLLYVKISHSKFLIPN